MNYNMNFKIYNMKYLNKTVTVIYQYLTKHNHSGPSLLRSVVFIGAEFAIINTRLVYTGEVQPAGSLHTDRFYRQPGPGSRPELSLQSGE